MSPPSVAVAATASTAGARGGVGGGGVAVGAVVAGGGHDGHAGGAGRGQDLVERLGVLGAVHAQVDHVRAVGHRVLHAGHHAVGVARSVVAQHLDGHDPRLGGHAGHADPVAATRGRAGHLGAVAVAVLEVAVRPARCRRARRPRSRRHRRPRRCRGSRRGWSRGWEPGRGGSGRRRCPDRDHRAAPFVVHQAPGAPMPSAWAIGHWRAKSGSLGTVVRGRDVEGPVGLHVADAVGAVRGPGRRPRHDLDPGRHAAAVHVVVGGDAHQHRRLAGAAWAAAGARAPVSRRRAARRAGRRSGRDSDHEPLGPRRVPRTPGAGRTDPAGEALAALDGCPPRPQLGIRDAILESLTRSGCPPPRASPRAGPGAPGTSRSASAGSSGSRAPAW